MRLVCEACKNWMMQSQLLHNDHTELLSTIWLQLLRYFVTCNTANLDPEFVYIFFQDGEDFEAFLEHFAGGL